MSQCLYHSPTSRAPDPEALERICEGLCALHGDLDISYPTADGTVRIMVIEPLTEADTCLSWLFMADGRLVAGRRA